MFRSLAAQFQRIPERWRFVAFISLCGLTGSLVAVAFHIAINQVYRIGFLEPARTNPAMFPWISLAVITMASLISGFLLTRFSPESAGSGIPQMKLSFWKEFGYVPARLPWVKFVASTLSIGGGQSLGKEDPSVQLGGGVASILAGWLGVAKQNRRAATAAGAAAFNAPLAAVTASPSDKIIACQALLINSASGLLIITDPDRKHPLAVVTLHDLLRAQASIIDREG